MKIKQLKYIGLLSLSIAFNSCNDVDINSLPTDFVSAEESIQDLNSATAASNGLYDLLYRRDYYGREMIVTPEVAADNILVSPTNSGRYLRQYQYSILPTDAAVEDTWGNLYKNINSANSILAFSSSVSDATSAELNEIMGHSYAIRGMAHFDLVRTYAFPYTTTDASIAPGADGAGGHLGVPLLLSYGQARFAVRETVNTVYNQVISDLETAMSLLPATAYDTRSKFNKTAVQALLSRVYLYKGDYPSAYTAANSVIQGNTVSLGTNATYMSNWDGVMEEDILLQLPAFADDNNGFDALASIYINEGDAGNGGYGDLLPTADVISLYSATDVRSNWFRVEDGQTYNFKFPLSWTNAIPLIRLSEVYLNLAEAAANGGGSITEGRNALNAIITRADPSASESTSSGAALLSEIMLERRKELAFEGHRLYDLVRWEQTIVRTDVSSPSTISTITYPDHRLIWPLPQTEIDANDSINENNVGY